MSHSESDFFYSSYDFHTFFKSSPQSLVLKANAPHFTILAVSDTYLELVHKECQEILGKDLFEAFPGSEGDPSEKSSVLNAFMELIETRAAVFQPIFKYEIFVAETNQYETHYWHNHHVPILDNDGQVAYIINTTTNITGRVQLEQAFEESRKREQALNQELMVSNDKLTVINQELSVTNVELQGSNDDISWLNKELNKSSQQLSLAIASAKLGTWYINVVTSEFISSPRLKEMFGFYPNEEMSYAAAIAQITEEHREMVLEAMDAALNKGQDYDLEYAINGYHDGILRWVRATGKLFLDANGKASSFSGTLFDITEQKADDQRKNDFIGMVSHELKTPLTTLSGYLQILQSKVKKGDGASGLFLFDKANLQVKKMTAMINGFLNVSRLESGKIHIERKRFDMAGLIKDAEEEAHATITSHQVVFAPVEETFVMADRDKISHVISNLLSNAVKYSPAGSTINVACVTINGMARVSVHDRGAGIAPEHLDKLFDRYYRTENAASSSVSGFGIGLYLSAEIVRRHDGRIWVESTPGKGSTFYFSLPVIA